MERVRIRFCDMASKQFKQFRDDPALKAELLPDGSLAFEDGAGYMVIGPNFISVADSDDFAFGDTREEAISNYRALMVMA